MNDNQKTLSFADKMVLNYTKRSIDFLVEERKRLNEELRRARRAVRRLEKKTLKQ